ncbi:unnamed protein product, partial [Effrenium voratum]
SHSSTARSPGSGAGSASCRRCPPQLRERPLAFRPSCGLPSGPRRLRCPTMRRGC